GDFADVPCPSSYGDWIEELYHQGVTGGCSTNPLRYCPSTPVSRGQMAVFLAVMFGLPNPPVSPYDWAQFHFEPGHSGNNTVEALVSRDNIASLAPLFSVALPEVADGAPIVAVNVATASGPRNVVFVTTKAGRISARDARTGA